MYWDDQFNILRGKRVEDLFHKQCQEAWRAFCWIYHESFLLIPWKKIRLEPLLVSLAFPCIYLGIMHGNYILYLWSTQWIEKTNERYIHYQLRKSEAVDQIKKISMEVMEAWQIRVMKLYSTTSIKNQKTLTPIANVAAIFGSLHSKISATVVINIKLQILWLATISFVGNMNDSLNSYTYKGLLENL